MTSTPPNGSNGSPDSGEGQIARLFEMTSDLLATISLDGRFTLLNPAWEQLLGWTLHELKSRPIEDFIHPDDAEQTLLVISTGNSADSELESFSNRYRHRDGSWRWLLWSARRDGDTWYASAKDVTDRMWLERQALHDPLTRLPNRLLLMDRAHQALSRLHRSNGVVAMLFIDLDKFKAVNDTLGHDVGDRLLIAVSERLAELMRDTDTIARMGGDEFVILADRIESEAEALALAERVLDALARPIQIGSAELTMQASVGVSASRSADTDPESMLREADLAMYRAKGAGGRRLELFDEELRREVSTQVELGGRLRDALPRHELLLAYQPILPLAGGQAVGCEALVRWRPKDGERSPGGGDLLPGTFLPPAEASELIVQIGNWVLHAACRQNVAWQKQGLPHLKIAVNLTARSALSTNAGVDDVLRSLDLCHDEVVSAFVELTEPDRHLEWGRTS